MSTLTPDGSPQDGTTVPCPTRGCPGPMRIHPGTETERMLYCFRCGEYYYRIGAVICVRTGVPDQELADKVLGGSQSLKPEVLDRISDVRRKMGLPPTVDD